MRIRKARMTDVEAIHTLINGYAQEGLMLARSRSMLYESLREFSVVELGGRVVGVGGLHIIWADLAEVRALAIAPEHTGRGYGRQLLAALVEEARELDIPRVFALTTCVPFFEKCGFAVVSKETLPQKAWKECINCPQFPNCNETAVALELAE
ncbi:MAG: N-acetyltransferase [Bacillota bacterium]|nr:N-acetyltransferase [Bacillota bacterium]